ncbi:TIGR03862 family flavoprotein [Allorhizobium sp. BGMRC 0089]|uniref:TIGR03862 family flavoprotein n=1 Tax=Allorhizobium sonneratiae TaxID=2934936 RepID=UPI002033F239|nr:TIGR03862 family flavoprotein [Allorhizobium sonneratiae]MCM2294356.1 TIGR03862 family flavoprotein [Allorhizobium sonneratiae]
MKSIAIIGGGPAGLMAADCLAGRGFQVSVYEAKPTMGRKLLMAGKSGLNLTHSEDYQRFVTRFGAANARLKPALDRFTPADLRNWAASLGVETFVGTSGRVFPNAMKASPLLRAWLTSLETRGVKLLTRHRWTGFSEGGYGFETPHGPIHIRPDAVILALGGASWPGLGSDAAWVPWLAAAGVAIVPFRPANCGFDAEWSAFFRETFSGHPIKSVAITSAAGRIKGEFVITRTGVEGSLVYAHAAALRDALEREGQASLQVDLVPDLSAEKLRAALARQPAGTSLSNRLRKGARLEGVKAALLRDIIPDCNGFDPERLATAIKSLTIPLLRPRPIAEAISSAGGIDWQEVDDQFMLIQHPGLFAAGEMLDWEAPTGGYLLTACLATGKAAAEGAIRRLK